jgi:hypothetical protein
MGANDQRSDQSESEEDDTDNEQDYSYLVISGSTADNDYVFIGK